MGGATATVGPCFIIEYRKELSGENAYVGENKLVCQILLLDKMNAIYSSVIIYQ